LGGQGGERSEVAFEKNMKNREIAELRENQPGWGRGENETPAGRRIEWDQFRPQRAGNSLGKTHQLWGRLIT